MAIYLSKDEIKSAYTDATKYSRQWFEPFSEFERIASNLPSPTLPDSYPKVTDGTLPALISETPMRIWAQLQTGRAVSISTGTDDYQPWKEEMVNVLWANKIIPNANTQAPFFSKLQTALYRALVYGSQPLYAFQVNRDGYVGSDFVLPYIKDVKLEPGKVSDRDCDYIFLDTYYTKLQIKKIIETAKNDKDGLSGWDVKALEKVLESGAFGKKDSEDESSSEQTKESYSDTVKFVTCFQRGYGAPFTTIVPGAENITVRETKNTNRTGDIPIVFVYNQQDLINPYGRGQIELAGPTQNMIDFLVAAHALATMQGLEPSLKIKGPLEGSGIELDTLNFSPGNLMMIGNADVDTFNPTTSVYTQFPNNYGIYKTQVMNLQGTSDASVSAESGNPQYSKTPAGVKYQQERTNAKDNFLRQRADEAFAALAKVLINLYLGNIHGSELISITDDQRDKLTKKGMSIPEEDNEVLVEFEEIRNGEFDFDVDPNSSIVKNDDDTKQRLMELLEIFGSFPDLDTRLAREGKEFRMSEYIGRLLSTSGIEEWDKILTELSPETQQALLAQTGGVEPTDGAEGEDDMAMEVEPGAEDVAMAEEAFIQPEGEITPEAPQAAGDDNLGADYADLINAGLDHDSAVLAIALRRNGWSDEMIADFFKKEESVR